MSEMANDDRSIKNGLSLDSLSLDTRSLDGHSLDGLSLNDDPLPPPLRTTLMPSPSFEKLASPADDLNAPPSPPQKILESPVHSPSQFATVQRPSRQISPIRLSPRQSPGHRKAPSQFASPINLPIRSLDPELDQSKLDHSKLDHSKSDHAKPRETNLKTTPTSPTKSPSKVLLSPSKVSPRRSFYLDKSVPIASDEEPVYEFQTPNLSHPDAELIFDDHDQRLPPPEDSPSHVHATNADIIAISSPDALGSRAKHHEEDLDRAFEEDFNYISPDDDVPDEYIRQGDGIQQGDHIQQDGNIQQDYIPQDDYIPQAIYLPQDDVEIQQLPDLSPEAYDRSLDEHDLDETIPYVLRVPVSPEQNPDYPAPIPQRLMRPPRLSRRHHSRSASLNLPAPPDWSHSPSAMERDLEFVTTTDDGHTLAPFDASLYEAPESDIESDRATIESDDRDDLDDARGGDFNTSSDQKTKRKWFRNPFKPKPENEDETQDEMGEAYDENEAKMLRQQMAVIDDDLAFSRLDPETVQRHAQMFNAGGLHSSITPRTGGPTTSLIEELEIRKAGKRVQRQVFFREVAEMERQRQEDSAKTNWVHPASIDGSNVQPTLLQMQYMAEQDYKTRIQWHTRAINQNYIQEHAHETLAQRRARLKTEKKQKELAALDDPAQETLAQRRARLRREKMINSGAASLYSTQTGNSIQGMS